MRISFTPWDEVDTFQYRLLKGVPPYPKVGNVSLKWPAASPLMIPLILAFDLEQENILSGKVLMNSSSNANLASSVCSSVDDTIRIPGDHIQVSDRTRVAEPIKL